MLVDAIQLTRAVAGISTNRGKGDFFTNYRQGLIELTLSDVPDVAGYINTGRTGGLTGGN